MRPTVLLLAFLTLSSLAIHAQRHFRVLHGFGSGKDGGGVWDSVAFDQHGNLYGTTSGGGAYGQGIVFKLVLQQHGNWAETVLHSFPSSPDDGQAPMGGVVLDAAGGVYGTTLGGGANHTGTVFKLTPGSNRYAETILYSFCALTNCLDGGSPWGSLIMDGAGNLYGTAYAAFEMSPGLTGWTEDALHLFAGKNGDGLFPQAGPIRDGAGNLYGTTEMGGGSKSCGGGCGTVWQLQLPAGGALGGGQAWTEQILHSFSGDQAFPGVGQLAMDPQGNLYGAVLGGKYKAGVIYRLSPVPGDATASPVWQETVLYNFTGHTDGGYPEGVIVDSTGNLYGICGVGGQYGEGTVFRLSPQADGTWKYTLLHTFTGADGAEPTANPTLGPDGKLYGTAATGGPHGGGVVYQLTP